MKEEGFERKNAFDLFNNIGNFLGQTDVTDSEQAENAYDIDDIKSLDIFQKFIEDHKLNPDDVVRAKRERFYFYDGRELSKEYYAPSDSMELYDEKTDMWFNLSGQQMRQPKEFILGPGDSPFGDE